MNSRTQKRFGAIMAEVNRRVLILAEDSSVLYLKGTVFVSTHENHDPELSFHVRQALLEAGYEINYTGSGFSINW